MRKGNRNNPNAWKTNYMSLMHSDQTNNSHMCSLQNIYHKRLTNISHRKFKNVIIVSVNIL